MSAAVEVRNLRFRYPDGTVALDDISFAIAPGECVGLIGPNGAGKSTLLLHLNGLLPEQLNGAESVRIGGDPICPSNAAQIRRRVGLLFQDPNDQLFCSTVREDVAFGPEQFGLPESELRQRVEQALAQVGLTGFEDRAPHHLSTGEKRRVCLAGVLACDPGVLVLDEPTSNLDPRARRELKQLLRAIPMTRIIATHDLELVAEICSRAILLDHGKLIADDPAESILADEQLMLRHGLEKPHILLHRHPHGQVNHPNP